jgi:hypothetical protein
MDPTTHSDATHSDADHDTSNGEMQRNNPEDNKEDLPDGKLGDVENTENAAQEEWLTTGSEYVGMRIARYIKENGKKYAAEGIITGWLPIELADFVSDTTSEVSTRYKHMHRCLKRTVTRTALVMFL